VLNVLPGGWSDMFPWLAATTEAQTEKAANDAAMLFIRERPHDADRLFAALRRAASGQPSGPRPMPITSSNARAKCCASSME
jgi:hypothetical protein